MGFVCGFLGRPNQRPIALLAMTREAQNAVLIAVELGAEWPRWMSDLVRKSPRRVVSQEEGEEPQGFAERASRVAQVLGAGSGLGSAVVLCNERTDEKQDSARRRLAASLLPGLRGRGKLVLTGSAHASEPLRNALKALAREVESGQSAPPVLRFGERTESSRAGSRRPVAKVA
jgi:hypothetical protein